MKNAVIVFLALIVLIGGRTPAVLAEEQHFDTDEIVAEAAVDAKEDTVTSQIENHYDDFFDEETENTPAEEEVSQNNLEDDADVTITKIGEGEVEPPTSRII